LEKKENLQLDTRVIVAVVVATVTVLLVERVVEKVKPLTNS
jgi:hypothetical protein